MRLAELAVLYGLVGVGCAVAVLVRRNATGRTVTDAVLLVGFWPLYGPFLMARWPRRDLTAVGGEAAFLAALRRAEGTPLVELLPDQNTVRQLGRRLRVAAGKVVELDELLAQPDFREGDAIRRLAALQQRNASACAVSTANLRIQNIRRLRGLRDRFARELDEVGELLTQLTTQAEVVRLAGAPDAETEQLVREIVSRVEGLDRVLDDDPSVPLPEVLSSTDVVQPP